MEPNQHQDQRTAEEEFQQSLDELEQMLKAEKSEADNLEFDTTDKTPEYDLALWEDAVTDIEEYLKQHKD